jgi:hypothetical protein
VGRQLLILLLDDATETELEAAVEEHGGGYPSVYVVAPAHVKALEWLATDEARAHGEADVRALEAEWLLAGSAEIGGGEAGSSDPVQAVADALERFPADEIVVVGSGEIDPHLLPQLRALGPPVSSSGLTVRPESWRTRIRAATSGLSSGRNESTPWVAFVGANLGLLLIAIVIAAVGMLIVWLATSA